MTIDDGKKDISFALHIDDCLFSLSFCFNMEWIHPTPNNKNKNKNWIGLMASLLKHFKPVTMTIIKNIYLLIYIIITIPFSLYSHLCFFFTWFSLLFVEWIKANIQSIMFKTNERIGINQPANQTKKIWSFFFFVFFFYYFIQTSYGIPFFFLVFLVAC